MKSWRIFSCEKRVGKGDRRRDRDTKKERERGGGRERHTHIQTHYYRLKQRDIQKEKLLDNYLNTETSIKFPTSKLCNTKLRHSC